MEKLKRKAEKYNNNNNNNNNNSEGRKLQFHGRISCLDLMSKTHIKKAGTETFLHLTFYTLHY